MKGVVGSLGEGGGRNQNINPLLTYPKEMRAQKIGDTEIQRVLAAAATRLSISSPPFVSPSPNPLSPAPLLP